MLVKWPTPTSKDSNEPDSNEPDSNEPDSNEPDLQGAEDRWPACSLHTTRALLNMV